VVTETSARTNRPSTFDSPAIALAVACAQPNP